MEALQEVLTDELLPQLESITPGSGCYLNEVKRPEPSFNPAPVVFHERA